MEEREKDKLAIHIVNMAHSMSSPLDNMKGNKKVEEEENEERKDKVTRNVEEEKAEEE